MGFAEPSSPAARFAVKDRSHSVSEPAVTEN